MGSGKGYLSSHLSMQYGLQVFGIDSSSTNTHGAQERNRKMKRFSRGIHNLKKEPPERGRLPGDGQEEERRETGKEEEQHRETGKEEGTEERNPTDFQRIQLSADVEVPVDVSSHLGETVEWEVEDECITDPFLSALSLNAVEPVSTRVPPNQLSREEKERRMRENLERKLPNRKSNSSIFLPLTSYVTAETELREIIPELEVKDLI